MGMIALAPAAMVELLILFAEQVGSIEPLARSIYNLAPGSPG